VSLPNRPFSTLQHSRSSFPCTSCICFTLPLGAARTGPCARGLCASHERGREAIQRLTPPFYHFLAFFTPHDLQTNCFAQACTLIKWPFTTYSVSPAVRAVPMGPRDGFFVGKGHGRSARSRPTTATGPNRAARLEHGGGYATGIQFNQCQDKRHKSVFTELLTLWYGMAAVRRWPTVHQKNGTQGRVGPGLGHHVEAAESAQHGHCPRAGTWQLIAEHERYGSTNRDLESGSCTASVLCQYR